MTLRTGTSRSGDVHRYYTCMTQARAGKSVCKGRSIRMDRLDQLVTRHLSDSLLQPDRMGGAVDYSHRLTRSLSAFGQGWAGVARDPFDRWQTDYGALGGVRFRW